MLSSLKAGDMPKMQQGEEPDESSKAMLAAAWRLLLDLLGSPGSEGGQVGLFERLGADEIARQAGLTSGAFYKRWKRREDFIDDMIDFSLSDQRMGEFEATITTLQQLMDEGSNLRQLTEAGAAADLQSIEDDMTFAVQINLWSLCRARPELREKLRVLYD